MSLPPGFLDELRARVSLSEVVGRKVVWDQRKSNAGKGDMWAPCPFHHEKTPSFHVDDRQGYYYCFGCHQKGDAITFLREIENLSFMEAVESLATQAGMQMPAPDPKAKAQNDRRSELAQVMEQALRHFRLNLASGTGAAARDYLAGRGLDGAAQDRWEIGFARDGWQHLWEHLRGAGVTEDKILDAGLARESSKGGKPYDVFRNRIIFPIRDPQGRCIAFGGRAMDPEDGAKYLNSPETLLFDKGRSLYNHGPARSACGKGQPLVVAEGYMDVIALSDAGFASTVAPLGTAITEEQLRLIWRMDEEPIIALDGDTAGLRAAMRLIDLALPLLEPGRTLRFCVLPQGQDPDDLLKSGGPEAMRTVLDKATPLVEMLWRRETEGKTLDSPERRAALDRDLRRAVARIPDGGLKGHYMDALRARRDALFGKGQARGAAPGFSEGAARRPWRGPGVQAVALSATAAARGSYLVTGPGTATDALREAVILAILLAHPALLETEAAALEDVTFATADHARIAACLLAAAPQQDAAHLRQRIADELGSGPLERLEGHPHLSTVLPASAAADLDIARLCLREELAKLSAQRGAVLEIAEASDALDRDADEWITWRLGQVAAARNDAVRGQDGDKAEYDIAPNGARLDKGERSELDRLLEQIRFGKPGNRRG